MPVMAETDVLVVGSGPAGLAAAISSAREGVPTMLAERYGCFGGVITQVGVGGISWYRHEGTTDVEGIGIEFERRARELGGTTPRRAASRSEGLHPEMFKYVADRMILDAGVRPILHCLAVDALMDGDKIVGVITESKSGRGAILAKRVIDATGDADIAWRAGAPCRKTPVEEMMGVTVMFSCAGLDNDRVMQYVTDNPSTYSDWDEGWAVETTGKEDNIPCFFLSEPFKRARQEGVIPPHITSIAGSWHLTDGGLAHMNMIYLLGYDCTDVRDLTRAEMDGRQHALYAIEALRRYVPGFEGAKLLHYGMTLGTRDSRKILSARYDITGHDVRNEARFEDSIGIFPEFLDAYGVLILPTTGRYFEVPYGILLPQKVENLLVAGRCVAGDKMSHAATRAMMCGAVTGQGAGVAAAVSLREGVSPGDLDVGRLQRALVKQGVRIH